MKSFNEFVRDVESTVLEYNQQTENLYKRFATALDKEQNGGVASGKTPSHTFASEVITKLGFDFSELKRAGVIERSPYGNYQINRDLLGTNGKLGKTPPAPPPLPRKDNPYSKIQTMKSPAAPPPPPRRS